MIKQELHRILANRICNLKKDTILFVSIDGVDTSGKTTLANELKQLITSRPVVRLSIDGFHNTKEIRTHKGEFSPEGYYYDSFNYEFLTKNVFDQIKSGNYSISSKIFDYRTEKIHSNEIINIPHKSVIIFDGVFLLRKELFNYWDLSVFLDVSFETVIRRAKNRDIDYFADMNLLIEKYNRRYIPGQKLYFESENPKSKADMVIDYNDYENPVIIKDFLGSTV